MVTAMFLSILLLVTILFAFATGIVVGYWVILAILEFFDPRRFQRRGASALAPSPSGD